jgi:hypothetical protein
MRPDEVQVLAVVLPCTVAGEGAQRVADLGDEREAERGALALEVVADAEQRVDVRLAPGRIIDRGGKGRARLGDVGQRPARIILGQIGHRRLGPCQGFRDTAFARVFGVRSVRVGGHWERRDHSSRVSPEV